MELLCIEIESEPRGYLDPVFLDDERVLRNLLVTEEKYTISSSYFKCFQTELQSYMRNIVCSWMAEVCEEEKCQEEVFPLAMNIMDRFLSVVRIRKNQLQLLGAVCLFLASKLRQTHPLEVEKLVIYTDFSVRPEELLGWELLVLSRLKWDLAAITPNDFVNPLLRRLSPWTKGKETIIKRHTQTFIALCAADFKFSMNPPSMVAAACMLTAIMGLKTSPSSPSSSCGMSRSGSQWQLQQAIQLRLNQITGIEVDCLRECQEQIETLIASHVPKDPSTTSSTSSTSGSMNNNNLGEEGGNNTCNVKNCMANNVHSSTGSSPSYPPSPPPSADSTMSSSSSSSQELHDFHHQHFVDYHQHNPHLPHQQILPPVAIVDANNNRLSIN